MIELSDGRVLIGGDFVNATGDANLCVAAGCESMTGKEARDLFGDPRAPTNAAIRLKSGTQVMAAGFCAPRIATEKPITIFHLRTVSM